MKTIKQIADELGVSKQAVFYRIKRPPLSHTLQSLMVNENGVLMVQKVGQQLIKQAFSEKIPTNRETSNIDDKNALKTPKETAETSKEKSAFDAVIALFQQELEAKNKLIDDQQQSINKLTTALEQTTASLQAAQLLHGGTMQQHLTDGGEVVISTTQKPKGIFARLFRKE